MWGHCFTEQILTGVINQSNNGINLLSKAAVIKRDGHTDLKIGLKVAHHFWDGKGYTKLMLAKQPTQINSNLL